MTSPNDCPGKVYLVGAGPGDPDLITVKAARLIGSADVLVFDALANSALLTLARPEAEKIDVGKRANRHTLPQDQINRLLADLARTGKTVVRLKGGDPYVFGRGSEEAISLHQHGIPVEVVPGITAGIAGPAYAGIPVTHRRIATTCTFITGHEDPTKDQSQTDFAALAQLARRGGTLCFYMGMGRLALLVEQLTGHGLPAQTPLAVVQWGTTPHQRSLRTTLGRAVADVQAAGLGAPSIIVIGQVASLDEQALNWFEHRPLFGQTIAITRTRHQASALRRQLEDLGAAVIEAPTIVLADPPDWQPIRQAVENIDRYDWLVLTSTNGVDGLCRVLEQMQRDARHLAGVRIAAIGQATADRLADRLAVRADLVPTRFVAESLAGELLARHDVAGRKILMLRADIARPALNRLLTDAGAEVTDLPVYLTRPADRLPDELLAGLEEQRIDWITFTSSSTVQHFIDLLGPRRPLLDSVKLASIGPITTETAGKLGLSVTVEAARHDIPGLVQAIVDWHREH